MPSVLPPALTVGMRVEVRSGFDAEWHRGFIVQQVTESGYVLCRESDGSLLPELPHEQVRRERKRETWWV